MPALLGQARQLRRAFAHLRHRTGRRLKRVRPQRLDRVDHRDLRLFGLQRGQNLLEIDLGQQLQRAGVEPQPAGAQRDLLARFLAADVEHLAAPLDSRDSACSSSVLLPMPGSPPISTTPPATRPPPSTRSNSSMPVADAVRFARLDLRQVAAAAPPAPATRNGAPLAFRRRVSTSVFQAPQPGHCPCHFGLRGAAFGAAVDRLAFCHDAPRIHQTPRPANAPRSTGTRGASAQNSS